MELKEIINKLPSDEPIEKGFKKYLEATIKTRTTKILKLIGSAIILGWLLSLSVHHFINNQ